MYRNVTPQLAGWFIPFRDSDHADSINVRLTRLAQALPHGIAAEPDPGRQLQEKAGGVTPAGLFSLGVDSSLRRGWCGSIQSCHPPRTHAGDPVRRGFSVQSSASLEYWIVAGACHRAAADPVADDDIVCVPTFSRRIAPESCWLDPAIHVFSCMMPPRRGCPGQARA
jgi:hypothetical protein